MTCPTCPCPIPGAQNLSLSLSTLFLPLPFPSSSTPPFQRSITPSSLLLLLSLLLPLLLLPRLTHHILFSPLSRLPGPLIAKYGPYFPLHLFRLSLSRSIALLHAHHGRGSAVVIAPNIVSLSHPSDVRRLYGSHRLRKDPRLGKARFGGTTNLFAELDPSTHAKLLRLTSPSFRPTALLLTQPSLHRVLRSFCARIQQDTAERGSADVWKLYRLLSFDMLSGACFGQVLGCVESGEHRVVKDLDAFMIETAIQTILPTALYKLLKLLPLRSWQFITQADQRLADYGLTALHAHRALYPTLSPAQAQECGDMLGPLRLSLDQDTGLPMSDAQIAGNLATYILAGADTTPAALSFITWELARRADVYAKLRGELEAAAREAGLAEGEDWRFEQLKELPYLAAVVKEGLRRYPPTVMPMTRVVPREGLQLSPAAGGEMLEAGTYVCASPWNLQMDATVFPEPERFEPERWLSATEEERKRMEESWMPFGLGVRACQGKLLAEMELYLTLATVVSRFELRVHPRTTEEGMREVEMITLGPRDHRCEIIFLPKPMEVGL